MFIWIWKHFKEVLIQKWINRKSIAKRFTAAMMSILLLAGCYGSKEYEQADTVTAFAEDSPGTSGSNVPLELTEDEEDGRHPTAINIPKGEGASPAAGTLDKTITPHDNGLGDILGLTTVIFSIVLFLLGILNTFDNKNLKVVIMAVSCLALIWATVLMLGVPMQGL